MTVSLGLWFYNLFTIAYVVFAVLDFVSSVPVTKLAGNSISEKTGSMLSVQY